METVEPISATLDDVPAEPIAAQDQPKLVEFTVLNWRTILMLQASILLQQAAIEIDPIQYRNRFDEAVDMLRGVEF